MPEQWEGDVPTIPDRLVEPDEMLGSQWKGYELIDGVPVEHEMSQDANDVTLRLILYIGTHLQSQPIGRLFGMEKGFRLWPERPRTVRKPDIALVSFARYPQSTIPRGHLTWVPDLVVEAISPNDLAYAVETKLEEYHAAGVRLLWVVYPHTETIVIRRLNGTASEVGAAGTLTGEDVLPGFACAVAELFNPPDSQPPAPLPTAVPPV
jgi:Uma2 family endonuclease